MLPDLEELLGEQYGIYGDPIFGRTDYVSRGFPRALANERELDFNVCMNAARVSIENVLGIVVNLWTMHDFTRYFKLHQTSPARTYLNAQFLTNCHNCIKPNQAAQMFGCRRPALRDYSISAHHSFVFLPAHVIFQPLEGSSIPIVAVDDTPVPGWLCARRSCAGSYLHRHHPGTGFCVTAAPPVFQALSLWIHKGN